MTNSSFGRDGAVTYEAVAPSQIKAMTWTREGELQTLREEATVVRRRALEIVR